MKHDTTSYDATYRISHSRHNWHLRTMLLAALVGVPLITLPQIARAADHPVSGPQTNAVSITKDNANVIAGSDFSVDANSGTALSIIAKGELQYHGDFVGNTLEGADGGINVLNTGDITSGNVGSVTIDTVADITANSGIGVNVTNLGTGAISITTADVIATTFGIQAQSTSTSSTGNITINAHDVTGADGIKVANNGTGTTNITTTGDVTGSGTGSNYGIFVQNNYASTGDTIINTVNVTGTHSGIYTKLQGTGSISIDSTGGTVEGNTNYGIYAWNATGGSASNKGINITTANVISHGAGSSSGDEKAAIYAMVGDSGNLTVDTTAGDITADGSYSNGVFALRQNSSHSGTAGDVTVHSKNVSGTDYGIFAQNYGVGNTTVTATGTVTGDTQAGIYAENTDSQSSDVTVEANQVSGGTNGIYASNKGTGKITVTTTGNVTGEDGTGIYASSGDSYYGGSATDNINITTADVLGGYRGIQTNNYGTGGVIIDTTAGTVTATDNIGIYSYVEGGEIQIDTGKVTAGFAGIYAQSHNPSGTGNITIQTTEVEGGNYGINVSNAGSGNIDIISTGKVQTTGTDTGSSHMGIFVEKEVGSGSGDINVQTAEVDGGFIGINVINNGTGDTTIDSSAGKVTGGGTYGILAVTGQDNLSGIVGDISITTANVESLSQQGTGISAVNWGYD